MWSPSFSRFPRECPPRIPNPDIVLIPSYAWISYRGRTPMGTLRTTFQIQKGRGQMYTYTALESELQIEVM
eukprot:scaffold10854_cov155-Skeletonema_dohrnii-CCMP3373.AAC.2